MSLPPYSPGTVMPSKPSSPSLPHRSCGKTLSWSICAARGAISASANRRTASRRASRSSPKGKLRISVLVVDQRASVERLDVAVVVAVMGAERIKLRLRELHRRLHDVPLDVFRQRRRGEGAEVMVEAVLPGQQCDEVELQRRRGLVLAAQVV